MRERLYHRAAGFLAMLLLAGAAAPEALAQTLVIGNKVADSVGFADLDRNRMLVTRPTGQGPHEVAISPDGETAAVVAYGRDSDGHTVSLFDVASATPLKVIDLGRHTRPHGIAWLPDGRHMAITTEGSGHLVLVDADAGAVVAAIETGAAGSHMLALSPDADRAYVANLRDSSFSVIDIEARRLLRVVDAGEGSEGIAVTPDGREIWVSNRAENSVFVYDSRDFSRKAEIVTGEVPIRVAISPDGRHAVTSNAREGTLSVIDTARKSVVRTVILETAGEGQTFPVTLLFRPGGAALFVAMTGPGRIARIDTAGWTQTDEIVAGDGSDGLGYSPLALEPGLADR